LPAGRQLAGASGIAGDCCGDRDAWTTGNNQALGTSADQISTVWFTIANGITTEVFYPRRRGGAEIVQSVHCPYQRLYRRR
jgi:glucodextranase-like protein